MSDKSRSPDSSTPAQSPGQLLKDGREKLGFSQKEIASQLNLQTEIIDAVEKDAKDRLPAPTYVRGYIRNYAKLVKLDAEELIKLYENDAAGPPEIIPEIKSHTQASSADKPVKAVTYLITFALVLLVIAWLQSHYVVEKATTSENVTSETPNETGAMEEYQELPPYPPPDSSYSSEIKNTEEESSNETGLSVNSQQPLPGISENIVGTLELPTSEENTETTGNISETDQAGDSLLPSGDEIEFTLKKESWIEVYDSGNKRLYMGLAKPGDDLKISGTAPFDVLLGYSPGVKVLFNGKPFDPEPHSHSGIARFKLGLQENTE